jgi:hypothetical protein
MIGVVQPRWLPRHAIARPDAGRAGSRAAARNQFFTAAD